MTSAELKAAGERLFGRFWQTRLAEALDVDPSTVRRWVSGVVQVPGPVAVAVRGMVRIKEIQERGAT